MDLKIKDVAELLKVSKTTIRRWLIDGKIPAYRLHGQFRFDRSEIEHWMMSCKMPDIMEGEKISLRSEKTQKILSNQMGTQVYGLFRALHKGDVIEGVPGSTKEQVIRASVEVIANDLSLDADVLSDLLLDREKLMPTALNHGVGVPHTRDFLLQKPFDVVTVIYPQKPIDYGALDGKKVDVLFFLFASGDKRHLYLLAKIAHFVQQEENLAFLRTKPDKSLLLDYIKEWEGKI
ncbi:MAG: PTS sugar transporter subunit IIA [Chlamydiota bacterium]